MLTNCLCLLALMAAMAVSTSAVATQLTVTHVPAAVRNHSAAFAGRVDSSAPMRMQVVLPMRNKEKLREAAHALRTQELTAPNIWLAEVVNALWTARKRGGLN